MILNNMNTKLFLLFFSVLPIGCAKLEIYVPAPNEEVVKANLSQTSFPKLCIGNKQYNLEVDENGNAYIPVEKRIGIKVTYIGDALGEIIYCSVSTSFIPRPGKDYMIYSDWLGYCFVDVFQIDPDSRYGIVPDLSVGEATCE